MAVMGREGSWCLLGTTAAAIVFNLVHNLGFLILAVYVGLETSLKLRNAAASLFLMAGLQLAALSQVLHLCVYKQRLRTAATADLHTATLIPNNSPNTPLLVP